MANIHGLHVSMHCSMASEAMESALSFFNSINLISILLNYDDFGTVAASELNGVSWQRDIS